MYHNDPSMDKVHVEVDRSIEQLEALKSKVIVGFLIYWTLLAIATVITVWYFWF